MTVLLTITILILTGIAIWQITKIFELSKLGQKRDDSQIATEKDNDLNGKLMFAFLVFIYAVTIYSFWTYSKVLLPNQHLHTDLLMTPYFGYHLLLFYLHKL